MSSIVRLRTHPLFDSPASNAALLPARKYPYLAPASYPPKKGQYWQEEAILVPSDLEVLVEALLDSLPPAGDKLIRRAPFKAIYPSTFQRRFLLHLSHIIESGHHAAVLPAELSRQIILFIITSPRSTWTAERDDGPSLRLSLKLRSSYEWPSQYVWDDYVFMQHLADAIVVECDPAPEPPSPSFPPAKETLLTLHSTPRTLPRKNPQHIGLDS